jgi:hypothetical protein
MDRLAATAPPTVPIVAIGGVGGSGTRLVAQIIAGLGWSLGDDLNEAVDNLWFTLLFKRPDLWSGDRHDPEFVRATEAFRAAMSGDRQLDAGQEAWVRSLAIDRPQHDRAWLLQRVESLLAAVRTGRRQTRPWGWKEPNTHIFVDRLADTYPEMQYIHVVRNGLDMAYSANQNQLKLWGPRFLGSPPEPGPRAALRYWCLVEQRITRIAEQRPGRVMRLNFDAFCKAPEGQLDALMSFLGIRSDAAVTGSLLPLLRVPDSIGRFKAHGLGMFDASDVEYVRAQGFDTRIDDREARP